MIVQRLRLWNIENSPHESPLFDIDGTLVNTGGTGNDVMNQAFEEIFGVPNGLNGSCIDGFKIRGWIMPPS